MTDNAEPGTGQDTHDGPAAGNSDDATPEQAQAALDAMQKQVEDRKTYLADSQKEVTELRMEMAAIKAAREEIRKAQGTPTSAEPPAPWESPSEEFLAKLDENPSSVIGLFGDFATRSNERQKQTMTEGFKSFAEEIRTMLKEHDNPDRALLKDTPLAGQDWFDALPNSSKIAAVKALGKIASENGGPESLTPPGGSPGGTGKSVPKKKADTGAGDAAAIARAMFGPGPGEGTKSDEIMSMEPIQGLALLR